MLVYHQIVVGFVERMQYLRRIHLLLLVIILRFLHGVLVVINFGILNYSLICVVHKRPSITQLLVHGLVIVDRFVQLFVIDVLPLLLFGTGVVLGVIGLIC